MIVDAHAHFLPHALIDALRAQPGLFPSVRLLEEADGPCFSFCENKPTRPVPRPLYDTERRRRWLASQAIDCQVVGGWLDLFGYELPPDEGADWCRFMNEHMLGAGVPEFAALACIPLQNGKLAAKVLDEALKAGFCGVIIGTQPKGEGGELDDPQLDPFWEMASQHRATLFIHPMLACSEPRLHSYDLVNSVGRIMDTTSAVSRLLFSGHLQRYPAINLLISHGGAALPYILGRLDKSHEAHGRKGADPRDGFHRLHYDTVLFDPRALAFLCAVAGADHVAMGSDHPFLFGDPHPLEIIDRAELGANARRLVAGENAARLFQLGQCCCRVDGRH
jgi:aminocarboxymuconate-semialdehyde decarboxylase